jgi:hypothetical protein
MSETNKGVIWYARFLLMGSLKIIPLSPQNRLLPREAGGFLFYRLTNQACLSEARWKIKSSYE